MKYDLFELDSGLASGIEFDMPDAKVSLHQSLYAIVEADFMFNTLKQEIVWAQEKIQMYGAVHQVPRLTAWYGDEGKTYTYSGITSYATPWTECLLSIKKKVEEVSKVHFNSVLLNLYRSGSDSVSWHSDNEPDLVEDPEIGSMSFGQERSFQMKHKTKADMRKVIRLGHGDFLLMEGGTQRHWLHQVPKSKTDMKERINLTFRTIY